MKLTCSEMEISLAKLICFRKNIIVPNISWGAGLHECDLLVINKRNYATEIEIKISKADLKKDFTKMHNHESEKIKYLYYAIPEKLLNAALELVPESAGIITCKKIPPEPVYKYSGYNETDNTKTLIGTRPAYVLSKYYRLATPNKKSRSMTDSEVINICRLGCMRIWNLKKKIITISNIPHVGT